MPFPSPRRLLAASATLFPAVLLFGHAEASILERCTADSQPRIGGAPALCMAPDYSSYRFIQSNEDGVLVVELDRETVDSGVPGLDGATVVQLNGRPGRLVYCSAESLQAGVADCGTNLAATDADPGVFVGTGKVYGDLRLDAWGGIACPSSINVSGQLSAPGNASFAVTGSTVFAANAMQPCESVYRNVDLRFIATADPLEDEDAEEIRALLETLSGVEQEQWSAVDAISQLDDQQFRILDWLLSADEQQISRVGYILDRGNEAYVLADGSVVDAPKLGEIGLDPAQVMAINSANAATILDTILSIVKTIKTTAKSTLNTVKNRLPNRPNFRDLVDTLPFDKLQQMIETVKDVIDPVMSVVSELRDGFDDFKGADCSGASPCAKFQNDIDSLFANVEFLFLSSQQLICFENPDFSPQSINTAPISSLVKKMPLLLQYGISKALKQVNFEWTLNAIAVQLPVELGDLCNDNANFRASAGKLGLNFAKPGGTSAAAAAIQEFKLAASPQGREIARCELARTLAFLGGGEFGVLDAGTRGIDIVLQVMSLISDSSDIVVKSQKDDIQVTIAGVAVGGGGGGTNVKNYLKAILEIAKIIIGRIEYRLNKLQATHSACLASDDTFERDLLACDVKVSYLAGGKESRWPIIRNLVNRRIATAKENGMPGIAEARAARKRANQLKSNGKVKKAYRCLCSAYQNLVLPNGEVLACD